MTDAEIIKAMECCCSVGLCTECPFEDLTSAECGETMLKEAIDLIKRQQETIEEYEILNGLRNKRHYYNKFVKEVWQKEKGELHYPDFDEIYKRYFEQQEMIDSLIAGQETLQAHFAEEKEKLVEQLSDHYRIVYSDEDLEWNRAISKAIAFVKGVQNEDI